MQTPAFAPRRVHAVLSFVLLYLFTSALNLFAQQSTNASITGNVVDSKGLAVSPASVVVKNQATGAQSKVQADNVGHFVVTGIAPGRYTLTVTAAGFAVTTQQGVVASEQPANIKVSLSVAGLEQNVEVSAIAGDSIAAQQALSQNSLDTQVPMSVIGSKFIQNFTPATTDYSEIVNIAPGTISYNSNGVGLGQGTIYFRGFIDGDFDVTWDGIPEGDTNNFTHHSWSWFPGPWIGSVQFD